MARSVRSGLITAQMETNETGVVFFGPLEFDEQIVCETGRWEKKVNPSDEAAIADALTEVYSSEFEGWCARKAAARAITLEPHPMRVPQATLHMPCPVLWAGR